MFLRALPSISGVMSTPMARPVAPSLRPAINTSKPPPAPKSNTTSPDCSAAMAVGLPQDSPMLAPAGNTARSSDEYPMCRTNSSAAAGDEPQQETPLPQHAPSGTAIAAEHS